MVSAAAWADNMGLGGAPSMVQGQIIWYEVGGKAPEADNILKCQ